uniref:Immunoglobulin V-set domain-containing protein n=1 Tax=Fundulus heteroclitus TaxID=8078 RepID=A0A3Q2PL10_FUNHE
MSFICMIIFFFVPFCFHMIYFFNVSLLGILQCNLTHRDEDKQCYGALGEPLTLHLPDHARMSLKDNNNIILKLANNELLEMHATRKTCWKFLMNGTFKCDKTTKNSSGVYQLEVYDTDGKINKTISINLQILGMN